VGRGTVEIDGVVTVSDIRGGRAVEIDGVGLVAAEHYVQEESRLAYVAMVPGCNARELFHSVDMLIADVCAVKNGILDAERIKVAMAWKPGDEED